MPYTFTENAAPVVQPTIEAYRTYPADFENYQPIIISSNCLNCLEYIFCSLAGVNDCDAAQRSRPAGAYPQLLIRTQAYLKARADNFEPGSVQHEAWERFFRIHAGARQLVRGHRPAGAVPSGTRGRHTPVLAHQLASARESTNLSYATLSPPGIFNPGMRKSVCR